MTKKQATAQARREIGRVYKTAANSSSTTFGFNVQFPSMRRPTKNDIGSYAQAIASRAEAIAERVDELL